MKNILSFFTLFILGLGIMSANASYNKISIQNFTGHTFSAALPDSQVSPKKVTIPRGKPVVMPANLNFIPVNARFEFGLEGYNQKDYNYIETTLDKMIGERLIRLFTPGSQVVAKIHTRVDDNGRTLIMQIL